MQPDSIFPEILPVWSTPTSFKPHILRLKLRLSVKECLASESKPRQPTSAVLKVGSVEPEVSWGGFQVVHSKKGNHLFTLDSIQ